MDKIVLTPEELSVLKELKNKRDMLSNSFGDLEIEYQTKEIQKKQLIDELSKLKISELDLGILLQEKYGDSNINITTGEIISR